MATTTPNFGWTVPTSSDLVKNGATAIETLGDAIDASLVDLKGGTTDQVLAKNSNTDMDFKWVTAGGGGGGKVLQVVTANYTTTFTTSSSTPADTGLTASITPSASTSKILVIATATVGKSNANSGTYGTIDLVRGSTLISTSIGTTYTGTANYNNNGWAVNYLDSPSTTSSTTYKIQASSTASAFNFGANSSTSTITLMEIGA